MRDDNIPIGYVTVGEADGFDLGYGLKKGFLRRGIMTEAAKAVLDGLKRTGSHMLQRLTTLKIPKAARL